MIIFCYARFWHTDVVLLQNEIIFEKIASVSKIMCNFAAWFKRIEPWQKVRL